MEYRDKRKRLLLFCIICCIILVFGVSWGIFKYSKYSSNASLVLGDIYMSSKENNILLNKLEPMSPNEGIEKGSKYNFSVEGYNTSNKDIYYGVYLNYGNEESGKTRFKDEDMMMYLTETKNGETKAVYGPGSVKDFNDKMIYASTIDSDTKKDEKIEIDYELTVWLSDNILISDTEESFEGKNIYTTNEYQNGYASINVKVYGDFEEKNIKKANENIVGTLISSNENYEIKDDIKNAKEISEDVKIVITTDKEAKLYLTNLDTNVKKVENLTLKNNLYLFEKIETDRSRYSYYFEYLDGTVSQIYYYNVNIKKYENINKPTNVLCSNNVYNGSLQLITSIEENNSYTLINNKQKDVGSYQITAKLKSGFKWIDETLDDVSFNCSIEKKDLIITPNAISKEYGTSDPELTYAYSGNVEGEIPKFSGSLQRANGEKLGSYLIDKGTLDIIDNSNFKKNNYNLVFSSKEVKFTIKEKKASELTVNLEYTEIIYDGLEHKPKVIIKDGTNTLIEGTDYDVSYKNNKNTGEATVVIVYKGNYSGTIEKKFTIKAKEVIVPTANNYCNTLTYNGTSQTLTKTAGEGYTFSNNTGIDAKEYTITVALKENYVWNDGTNTNKTFKCSIAKISTTVKASSANKTYDGISLTKTSGCETSTGLLANHTPICINSGSITNAGSNDNVLSNVVIKSGEVDVTSNYNITKENGTLKILKRAITYRADSESKEYDTKPLIKNTATLISGELVEGHTATFTISGTITNVGSVANVLSKVVIKNGNIDVSDNYNITKENGTLTIKTKGIAIPTSANYCNTLTYNGTSQTLTRTAGEGYTFSNNTGIDAKEYTITATLKENYVWNDGTNTNKTFKCSIAKKSIAITWDNPTLTYNGKDQSPTPTANSGISTETINLGKTTGKNAGNYTATATCLSVVGGSATCNNYTFTNTTKAFTINKAVPSLTISSSSLTTVYGTNTSFTYTYSGDGTTFTCNSSNTSVATCSVDKTNKKVIITPVKVGSANITLSVNAGVNYNTISKSINVIVNGITRVVTYTKGVGVASISKTSDSCTTTGNATSCVVNLPTITSSNGYSVDGWYLNSSKIGTSGSSYTLSGNVQLNAQATVNTYLVLFDTNVQIYNQNSANWIKHGSTAIDNSNTYSNTTGVKVYSNENKWTGLKIPIINAKKNTNYLLSVRAKKISDFSGNLRVYAPTYDSSNTTMSYNHGISITSSNITTTDWTYFLYSFNSGAYATMPWILIDYDTESTGPVYISDVHLTEFRGLNLKYGTKLGTLFAPTISGHTLNGWYTAKTGGTQITADTTVPANDITYYAHYEAKTYTINYNSNGGSGTMASSTATFGYEAKISANTFTKNGYTFAGWTTKSDGSDDGYGWTNWSKTWTYDNGEHGISNNTLNLYARWTPKKIKLTLNANGGNGGTTAIWYYYGTSVFYSDEACTNKITAITKPTKKGYILECFYGDGTSGGDNGEKYVAYDTTAFAGDLATDIYKDATLYAKWTPKTYTINYNNSNGSGTMASSTATFNTKITISANTFTKKGYTFAGWTTKSDGSDDGYGWTNWSGTWTYDNGEFGISNNTLNLYAKWTPKTYTINYNNSNGSGTMASSTATFNTKTTISANTFTKNGYTFAGWTTKSDGSDDGYGWTNWSGTWTYDNGEFGISNNTLNLYARWTPKKIKLTLNANGGSGGTTAIWYYYGTSVFYSNEACTNKITAITKPTKKGYNLEHFYGDGTSGGDNGERYVAYDTAEFASDLATDIYKDATLYAKWTPKTYTINYNGNNGSGSMTPSSVIFNTSVSIKSNAFTRSGYSFVGWSTKTDNSDDGYGWTNWSGTWSYDNGEYGISNNALNLYARWAPYYCATFNANGAASISKSSACCTATNGSSCTVTAPTITPKTNFEVLGWTTNTANLTVPTIAAYNDNGSLATITLTGNKTFYAVTKSSDDANKKYNVEFNLNGSDSYSINGVSYKETATFECHNPSVYNGAAIPNACSYTLPTITRNGGTVYGWDRNDANQGTPAYKASQTISLTDDISLSAITSRPIILSYNANGGTTTLTSQTAQVFNDDEGAWFNIPAYDNANMCRGKTNQYVGYKYVGLGTSSGASVTSNCQGSRAYLTQNTTLYALWKTYYATASHSVSSGLIIRKGEGTSYAKVTTIPRGVKVYVTGPAGSCKSSHKWFPVIYGNYSGYSSAGANCGTKNFSNFTYVADNSCSTSYACSATNNNMTASPSKIVLNIKTGVLSSKITVDAQCGSYSFSSSDTSVVTVSSDGTVSTTSSAVAEGAQKKATINITSAGGCTASVDVIVKNIIETAPTVNISFSGTTYSSGYKSPVTATVTCSSQEGIASFIPKDSKGGTFTITGDNYNKTATITLSGGSSGRTVSATCKSNNDLSASNSKTTKIYVYSASSACGVASYGYSGTCSCNTSVLYSKTCNSDIYNMGGCKAYCSNVYFTTGSGTCTRSSNYKSCYHT